MMTRFPLILAGLLAAALTLSPSGPAWSVTEGGAAQSKQTKQLRPVKKTASAAKRGKAKPGATARKAVQPVAQPAVAPSAQTAPTPPFAWAVPDLPPAVAIPSLTLTTQLSALPANPPSARPASPPSRQPAARAADPAQLVPRGNPYMSHPQQVNQPFHDMGKAIGEIKLGLPSLPALPGLPGLPPEGLSLLPVIKTVYPTGEKPLVIVTFKCPTELVGITPLPTKALHDIVTWGMDSINSTNLLAFNMQQVCQ